VPSHRLDLFVENTWPMFDYYVEQERLVLFEGPLDLSTTRPTRC
jgi:hypothetical protein